VSPTLRFDLKNVKNRSNSGRFQIYSLFVMSTMSGGRGRIGGENFGADQQQVEILWPIEIV